VTFKTSQNCSPNPVLSGLKGICKGNTTILSSNVPGGTWSSSNPSIATINSMTGNVTGLSEGCVDINYYVKGTNGCPDVNSNLDFFIDSIVEPSISYEDLTICIGNTTTISGNFDKWDIKDTTLLDLRVIFAIIDPYPGDICFKSGKIFNLIFNLSLLYLVNQFIPIHFLKIFIN
jgi:hypothetical protein